MLVFGFGFGFRLGFGFGFGIWVWVWVWVWVRLGKVGGRGRAKLTVEQNKFGENTVFGSPNVFWSVTIGLFFEENLAKIFRQIRP